MIHKIVLILTAVTALGAQSLIGEQEKTLSAEVIWKLERIGAPAISPDGRWVVAPVTRYEVEKDQAQTDLWLFSTDGEEERPLTRHESADGQAAFSPDGSRLAFVSKRDGDEAPQIYLLPMDQPGEAQRLTEIPTGVSAPKWGGDHLYFITRVWPDKDFEQMGEALKQRRESKVSAKTWDDLPISYWDHWVDERKAHVYRVKVDNGTLEPVTLPSGLELPRYSQGSDSFDVSPDGRLVVFVSDTNSDPVDSQLDVYLIEVGADEARNLTPENEAPDGNPLFSPDGSTLAFTRQRIKGFYADTQRLIVYDLATASKREVAAAWDRSADGLVWAHDGSGLFGAIDDAGTRRVHWIGLDGNPPRPITGDTDFQNLSMASNGTLVAQNHSFLHPPRLVAIDAQSGDVKRLDTRNNEVLKQIELGTYESVTYEGANGAPIQMWVHYPPGFDPDKKYPLFLLLHGGPHSGITDGFHFRWNAQTFASWGYVTAWHNFHGSSGFGQDFADSINPHWEDLPYRDTIKAARWFAEQPWIDSERMVAGGGSYGGYLASVLLGREHPFQALVAHAAVYNMYTQYAADLFATRKRFGEFWKNPELYAKTSPHYQAGNFSTPTLVIHGQNDLRVPVNHGIELFQTLRNRGVETRLVYYPDENHWILKPQNSLYWYEQVRAWIERFAAPGPQ
jgi:dipeptidyl aminopeptidase/acylaminoacyl peptidase